jgi:threonine/homoserine/homoserine lactone efflux protein
MRPLAHHAGEESLAALLLLGSGTLSFVVAIGRAHLAAARARLTRKKQAARRRG